MTRNGIDSTSPATGGTRVLASVVRGPFELAVGIGCDRARLLARMGIENENVLLDQERLLPLDVLTAVWEAIEELPGAETRALDLATQYRLDVIGVVGWVMANAPSARAALEAVRRYSVLFGDPCVPEIDYTTDVLILHRAFVGRIARARVMTESAPATTIHLVRELTGADADEPLAREVWFQHPSPNDPTAHERFFGCRVRFSSPETRLVLSRSAVERPVLRRSPTMYEYLERHARALTEKVEDRLSISERVRRQVASSLRNGEPSPADVARTFAMSERTMQRRLREDGSTFAEILDSVRRELAVRYLTDPELTVYEVAFLLGYAETSSFHRAFKRWTGEGPQEFRTRTGVRPTG